MARFTPKRHEQILQQMVAHLVANTELSDVADSSIWKGLLAAAARSDADQYYQMSRLQDLFSLETAKGEDLYARAKDFQPSVLTPREALKAVGTVVFSAPVAVSGTVTIPVGTKVRTAAGVEFTTTAVGTITPTSGEQVSGHGAGRDSNLVPATAVEGGVTGNVAASTVVKFASKPPGVTEVTNTSAFQFGQDQETDASFRDRIRAFIASLPRSTPGAIEAGVVGQQDPVTKATVLYAKVWEDTVSRGEVILYVDDGTGTAESSVAVTGENVTLGLGVQDFQKAIVAIAGADLVDGETFTIDDNVNTPTVFEFDDDASVTPGNVAVTFTAADDRATVAAAIEAAIDAVGGTLDVTASITENHVVVVTHDDAPSGVVEITETVTDANFVVGTITSALGGEETLYLDNWPVKPSATLTLTSSTRGALVKDTDFTINEANGQLDFTPALVEGEVITAAYTYFDGLIQFVQKVVDGDSSDRETYPGLRAAGVRVLVQVPQVLIQTVELTVTIGEGYDQDTVRAAVQAAVRDYINGLPISGDVIRSEIICRAMDVAGVRNVDLTLPADDIVILDDQLARTTDANITVN